MSDRPRPRIYVAPVHAPGMEPLPGIWVDVRHESVDDDEKDVTLIMAEIDQMLSAAAMPDAEWAIYNSDGFYGIPIPATASLEEVVRLSVTTGGWGAVVAGVVAHYGWDIDAVDKAVCDGYWGPYKSFADWAKRFHRDVCSHQDLGQFADYINWEAVARDAIAKGDYFVVTPESDDRIHVFYAR